MNKVIIETTHLGYRIPILKGGILKGHQLVMQDYYAPFIEDVFNPHIKRFLFINAYRFYDRDAELLYIPIFDLPRLKDFLKTQNIEYEIRELPDTLGKEVDIPLKPNFKPKDERQAQAIDHLIHNNNNVRSLALQTGAGKDLRLSAKIKIPGGWKLMKDVHVGDTITAWDGSPTTVTGIYPQGLKPVYRVSFEDGRYVDTGLEHLWEIFYRKGDVKNRYEIVTTKEIMDLISQKRSVYIRRIKSETHEDISCDIHPYVAGVYLGNNQLIQRVKKHSHVADMIYSSSYTRSVPAEYLNASTVQRLELLCGLFSAGKHVSTTPTHVIYKTVSSQLAKDIQYLVRSLGGIAHLLRKHPGYGFGKTRNHNRVEYSVAIPSLEFSRLFTLMEFPKTIDKLKVKSVRYIEEDYTQCIKITHPDRLFVTDDFIVTHNTASVIMASHFIRRRMMISMTSLADQWLESFLNFTNLKEDDIYMIQGLDSVHHLLENIDKTIFPKVIIANTPTMHLYSKMTPVKEFNDFCENCDIGVRVIDEVHLRFRNNLIMDLRFNPRITIPVTATFKRTTPKADRIFQQHYHVKDRFGEEKYDKYVKVVEYRYILNDQRFPKRGFVAYMGYYNHSRFEKWLLHSSTAFIKKFIYEEVHLRVLKDQYFSVRNDGEKALVLFSTIDICKDFHKFLSEAYPQFKIGCCVENAGIGEIAENNDIIITTLKKAGTGTDIKNLRTTYVTVSVNSVVENEQNLGRLRKLKDKSVMPIFAYNVCVSIPQQVAHARTRRQLFGKLALMTATIDINILK